ncbi:MAG TPA: glycosyltransferase family 87 protein [Candidatus Dormibacteraeota bacterium]
MDGQAWRNLGAAGLAWFLLIAFGFTAWFVVLVPLRGDVLGNDMTLTYMAVRVGLENGWSHIYDLDLQRHVFAQLEPGVPFTDGKRFISPPFLAWLLVPLSLFGAQAAVYIWLALSLAALVAAWWIAAPGSGWLRFLWLLGALAWYPVLYCLGLAQPDLIALLVLAAGWRIAESGRPYLAGAVLGLSMLKPQMALFVPVILLAAGRWRIVSTWAAVAVGMLLVSLVAIGQQGLADYQRLLADAQQVANNRYFSLAYLLGAGTASYVAEVVVLAVAVAGGYINRRRSLGRLFALGLVASTLGASYWHLQDYAVLVLAGWLFWRDEPPAWQRWWLLTVAIGGELAWPLTPLPILIGLTIWLACLVAPSRREPLPAPSLSSA